MLSSRCFHQGPKNSVFYIKFGFLFVIRGNNFEMIRTSFVSSVMRRLLSVKQTFELKGPPAE